MRDISMRDTLAVVLGGGAGTRLHPLTQHRSKPAVPLAGKYRLIDITLSNCLNSGLDRVFVLTQYLSASLNRHVARAYRFDRFSRGFVNILAAEQSPESHDWFQGTADAVRQSMVHLQAYPHEHVLILSGDQLYLMDYRKMLRHHVESESRITLATIPVTAEDAPGFGILQTDETGCITHFHEKPSPDELPGLESPVSPEMEAQGRVYLASMGIYLFDREELKGSLDRDRSANDFGKQIIPEAIGACRVTSYAFEDYWSDIGTIRSFFEANVALATPLPEFDLYHPRMPIYTNARMLPPAKVQDAELHRVLLSEAAVVVGSRVERAVVGLRAFVDGGCEIRDAVIMGNDFFAWHPDRSYQPEAPEQPGIGKGTVIERAIVDKNAQIGRNCRITNEAGLDHADGDGWAIRDGIIVVKKNARLPDGTVI